MGSLSKEDSQPPVATTKDHVHEHHGIKRSDPYYWLKDRANNEVISYLREENIYTDSIMAKTGPLQKELFGEIKARIKQDLSLIHI